ncbi:MAG: hypothetical protein DRQ78_06770 [Epsilonproteobacteria bacterium]|nr:MAG: hypothetical protein DRQ78_06770 [Campylobacterota bacterium]
MALRLEIILILAILGLVVASIMVKLDNAAASQNIVSKELEFTNTTFIETDTQEVQGKTYGTYGVRSKGVLTLDNLEYSTDSIDTLLANKGTFRADILYLDGDVFMQEKTGYIYKTEHANYNKKTKILNITSPFVSIMDENIVHGNTLIHDVEKQESKATGINAVVHTVESKSQ